jgi:hypothetical protein
MSNALSFCVFIIIINVLHSIGLFGGGKREQWCRPCAGRQPQRVRRRNHRHEDEGTPESGILMMSLTS